MTTRKEKLNRLQVASPCRASWDEMRGDERRRHCLDCNKFVYDTSKMTVPQIEALIEASRGNLCVRLTRNSAGELITLELPLPEFQYTPRRTSPVAAVMMTAIIGLNGQAWSREARTAVPVSALQEKDGENKGRHKNLPSGDLASLTGTISDDKGNAISRATINLYNILDGQLRKEFSGADGAFNFRFLGAGVYRLDVSAKGYRDIYQSSVFVHSGQKQRLELSTGEIGIETVTMGGAIGTGERSLLEAFNESEAIAIAYAGQSVVTENDGEMERVRTDLNVSSVLKGEIGNQIAPYLRYELPYRDVEDDIKPGDRVLVFLKRHEGEYSYCRIISGNQGVSDDVLNAYCQRIASLTAISNEGNTNPGDVMEWLVSTAENPHTRNESLSELSTGLSQLAAMASESDEGYEHFTHAMRKVIQDFLSEGGSLNKNIEPSVYAAFLSESQKERLMNALLSTTSITAGDLWLFRIVRQWNGDKLSHWLIKNLKEAQLDSPYTGREMMRLIAENLNDEELKGLVSDAESRTFDLVEQLYQREEMETEEDDSEAPTIRGKVEVKGKEINRRKTILGKIDGIGKELRQEFLKHLNQRRLK